MSTILDRCLNFKAMIKNPWLNKLCLKQKQLKN